MPSINKDIDDDKKVKALMDDAYEQSYLINSSFLREAEIDKRFKVGDQNLLSMMYGDAAFYNKRKFFFNLIRRHINMIAGRQRQNRKSSLLSPVEEKDQQLSEDYTDLTAWSERREGFHEYQSQAFEGALDTGIALLHMYNDYTLDPVSGDLVCDNVAFNNFLIDPWFRKQDLSDCNYIWRRRWVTKEKAKSLLPGKSEEIEKMRPDGLDDGRFPIQAEALSGKTDNLFTYDEYHYLSTREAILVVDTKTGETIEWEENPDDDKDELEKTLAGQPWLAIKKVQKPTVKLAILLGSKVMYHGKNLLGVDKFPFVPVLCYHDPDVQTYSWRIQGVIRNLRDAQYLYNRRRIIELDILESQINSGYKYKVGSVTDEAAFRQTGQGFLIPVNETHEMSDVERLDAPGIPSSMMEISRSLGEDITKISGVNEELLGSATDDKAGILASLRQGAGLTTLQTIFDKLDYSQKLYASLRLEAIRKNWSNGKIRNILGREPDPRFRLTNTQKFDVVVEQGVYSVMQQQQELQQLLHFREVGIPISDKAIIQASSIKDKNATIEEIQQQQQQLQQQQEQQQQAMAQQQEQEASNKRMVDFAKAKKDMAGAKELEASALNKYAQVSEIESQAQENRTQAELNLVEQMIKLEDMELSQLKESIALAEILKRQREHEEILSAQNMGTLGTQAGNIDGL